eukprot:m.473808 g.473808  ORF g.473808 m.473808 type:complete len:215 (+) comp34999_c0_seq1:189-833(+)
MFASPFFVDNGWGASPYEVGPYHARHRQAEAERRRIAHQRQREYEREIERRRRLELEQERRQEEAYQRALYEDELSRRRRRHTARNPQPTERIEYDVFGRPYRVVGVPDTPRQPPARSTRSARRVTVENSAAAARGAEKARAERVLAGKVQRLRQRLAVTKIQRWWREQLDRKYNTKPDPRIEEVDESFVLPRHRILPDTVDNVVMPLSVAISA